MTFRLSSSTLRASGLALSVLLAMVSTEACSEAEAPSAAERPSTDVEAEVATTTALGMMGIATTPETPGRSVPAIERTRVARLRAIAGHLVAVTELADPGILRRLGVELRSENGDRFVSAYATLRSRLALATGSPELRARVAGDPLFKDALKPASAVVFELRGLAGGGGDDIPSLGRGPDGKYGDGKEGFGAALGDASEMLHDGPDLGTRLGARASVLTQIDQGTSKPDPESRLGAYAATAGYPEGTVGNAVHRAIGTIYVALGTAGQEHIGRVFNSPEARALYNSPVDSEAGARMAAIEQRYWANVAKEDAYSFGGRLGAAFSPSVRDWLQRNVFALGKSAAADAGAGDGGSDEGTHGVDVCAGKEDGYYCSEVASYSAYQCEGGQISGGAQCDGQCGPVGSRATVDGGGQLICR